MKKSILTFGLIIWAVSAMFADDATIQKQLVGKWQSTDGQVTLKENGVVTCSPNDCGSSYRWNVQNGMFHKFYDVGNGQTRKNTYAKIIELSKTKFVLQNWLTEWGKPIRAYGDAETWTRR